MNYKKFNIKKLMAVSLAANLIASNFVYAAPQLRGVEKDTLQAIKLTGGVSIADKDKMISLSLRNSDVKQVLRMLADKASMNIIFHDSVQGTVTMDLINVPVNKAFEYIMTVNSLSYWVDGETLIVASRSSSGALGINKQQIKPIKIMYVNAAKVANFLNTNIFSLNNPSVSNSQVAITNPAKNEVLLFGTDKDIQLAQQVIAQLDVEQKINTFKVNHMPASKMASMICQTVFEDEGEAEDEEGDGKGGGQIACRGGESTSGSGASSTSTSGATASGATASTTSSGGASASGSGASSGASGGTSGAGSTAGAGATTSGTEAAASTAPSSTLGSTTSAQSSTISSVGGGSLQSFDTDPYKVLYYPDINEVSIMGGTQEQVTMAANFVKEFDKKQPQALVELSVIELNESGMKSLQSGWAYQNGKLNLDGGYADMNNPDNTEGGWSGSTGMPTGSGYIFRDHTGAEIPQYGKKLANSIKMLVTQSKARVLSNPKIIVTNNQESTVDISTEYLSRVTATQTPGVAGGAGIVTYEYEKESAGIQISIKPKITPDGYVTMDIAPTYTVPTGSIGSGDNTKVTFVSTRTLDLKSLRVKDGETFVLGGLIQETDDKSKSKIPVLGDIPVIGFLFGSSSNKKTRSELIIMVTPKIIRDNDSV